MQPNLIAKEINSRSILQYRRSMHVAWLERPWDSDKCSNGGDDSGYGFHVPLLKGMHLPPCTGPYLPDVHVAVDLFMTAN